MRIRTIKPSFWTSPDIAALPDDTHRLLFIGLWNYADDEGRGLDDPRLIKAALFPLDESVRPADVDSMMWRLPSVVRYEADGRHLFAIRSWSEHQRISHPKASVIVPPSADTVRRKLPGMFPETSGLEGKGREQGREGEGNGVDTPHAASPNVTSLAVPDRVPYFLDKLTHQDEAWAKVTVGAVVRIAKSTDMDAVTTALSFAAEGAPVLTGSAYGWLEATARGLHEAKAATA